MPFPEVEKENTNVYAHTGLTDEENFAEAFIQLGGKFIFCDSEAEMVENLVLLHESRGWKHLLCTQPQIIQQFRQRGISILENADIYMEHADACLTGCEMLVARTGSILLSSGQHMGRTSSVFYPVHIVFAYADQIVGDIDTALLAMKKKYNDDLPSMINLCTGPSRTADIEKTLVVGVHGPGEVFCFFINKDSRVLKH